MKYFVIKEFLYGDCRGEIYTRLVHDVSERFLDAETLKNFCSELWTQLYRNDNSMDIIFCMNQERYWFNPTDKYNTSKESMSWYRIYEDNNCVWCDLIKPIKEDKIKEETIAEDVCINEAFDIMRKEIDDNMTDCKFRVKAYHEVYDCLEHYEQAFFFIVNEEESCMITSSSFDMEKYYIRYSIRYINEEFTIKKYTKGDQK